MKSRLPLIPCPDLDQMVGVAKIQPSKDLGSLKELEGRGNERKRMAVLYSNPIESSVVDTMSQTLIFLLYKEKPSPSRGGGG